MLKKTKQSNNLLIHLQSIQDSAEYKVTRYQENLNDWIDYANPKWMHACCHRLHNLVCT